MSSTISDVFGGSIARICFYLDASDLHEPYQILCGGSRARGCLCMSSRTSLGSARAVSTWDQAFPKADPCRPSCEECKGQQRPRLLVAALVLLVVDQAISMQHLVSLCHFSMPRACARVDMSCKHNEHHDSDIATLRLRLRCQCQSRHNRYA